MDIHIRPITIEDAQTSVKWRNIPELWVHTKFKANREITLEDEINWVKKVTNDPTSVRFAIIADDTYVGNIYLTDIGNKSADYHIFIGDKNYWGKGVARVASVQIIDYGKEALGLETISLAVKKIMVLLIISTQHLVLLKPGTQMMALLK